MMTTRVAALTLAFTLSVAELTHAEVDYVGRYRFIVGFYTEMLACNHMGQNPLTPDFMNRLKAKIDDYASAHGIDETSAKATEAHNVELVNNQLAMGRLDGPRCYRTQDLLVGKYNDPVFWTEK